MKFAVKWGIIFALVGACFLWLVGLISYHGDSMNPALKDGDLLILWKPASLQPGDLICYRTEDGEKKVGRICGVEGEEITFYDGGWLLNGLMPIEEIYYPTRQDPASDIVYPHRVSGYFVLNDRRTSFGDSRTLGDISKEAVIGKVVFVFRIRGL